MQINCFRWACQNRILTNEQRMTAPLTGKPIPKPRTALQRSMLRRKVEQRVKDATPEQKAAVKALRAKHRAATKSD